MKAGDRVRLKANYPEPGIPSQRATVLEVYDNDCVCVEIDQEDRLEDDVDGIAEIATEGLEPLDPIGEYYDRIDKQKHAAWEKVRQAEAESPRDEAKIRRLREEAHWAGYTGD